MMVVAKNVEEIARGVRCILEADGYRADGKHDTKPCVEYFFRGEASNFLHPGTRNLGTSYPATIDRYDGKLIPFERNLYEDALRYNITSFAEDRTMVERLARMQHYLLPTRFADISDNCLLSAHFACDSSAPDCCDKDNNEDGFIRVIKVHPDKMKSFTSDIIVSIAHLPLVDREHIKPSTNELGYLRYEVQNERAGFYDTKGDCAPGRELGNEIQQVWAFRPILNTRRIRNQGGAFLAFGCRDNKAPLKPSFSPADYMDKTKPSWGIAQIGYICIPADRKKVVRTELMRFGMRPEVVYPELSNACSALKQRYLNNN